jgi:hypothetical protein
MSGKLREKSEEESTRVKEAREKIWIKGGHMMVEKPGVKGYKESLKIIKNIPLTGRS